MTATHGMVNDNSKWQFQSDKFLTDVLFVRVTIIPHMLYPVNNSIFVTKLSKIVKTLLNSGTSTIVDPTVQRIIEKFPLGTNSKRPGMLQFFGLNILQNSYFTISANGDDTLYSIESLPLSHCRHRDVDAKLNSIEAKSYASPNSSVGWLGITATPFCS